MRFLVSFSLCALAAFAQVDQRRLNNAAAEPQSWLTYNGSYMSQHHSRLTGINPANVNNLGMRWVFQKTSTDKFETTPLVADGVMYLTDPPSRLAAIDPVSGREFWGYHHPLPGRIDPCCGRVNRGAAILGNTLYWGTLDAKLLAVDAITGRKLWETAVVEDYKHGYSLTVAPLIVNGKVIVGTGGGSSASAASWRRTTRRPASKCGSSIPSRAPANRGTRPGKTTPGKPAAARSG